MARANQAPLFRRSVYRPRQYPTSTAAPATTLQGLFPELILHVLKGLSDFETLAALIKTCKYIYNIFVAGPESVVDAVAYNLVGPALPQALLLLPGWTADGGLYLARRGARETAEHASVVSQMEDTYSLRCAPS